METQMCIRDSYKEPIAHIFTFSVHRQRLSVADVVDEQRYELFGELVGTVVVGAVGHERRHSVGVVVGSYKVIGRCL